MVTEWSVPGILTSRGVDQLDLGRPPWRTTALGVDHHQRGQAGDFVHLLGHGQAFFDVLELHLTGELGDDRTGQRVPVGQDGAGLDLLVGLDGQRGAVGHLVALALAAMLVLDDDFARTGITTSSPLELVT